MFLREQANDLEVKAMNDIPGSHINYVALLKLLNFPILHLTQRAGFG